MTAQNQPSGPGRPNQSAALRSQPPQQWPVVFEYRARPVAWLIALGAGAFVIWKGTQRTDHFLLYLGIVFCALIVLSGILQLLVHRTVVIDPESITVPRTFSSTGKRILLSDIRSIDIIQQKSQEYLKIIHSHGTARLQRGLLPSPDDFEWIVHYISDHAPQLQ